MAIYGIVDNNMVGVLLVICMVLYGDQYGIMWYVVWYEVDGMDWMVWIGYG